MSPSREWLEKRAAEEEGHEISTGSIGMETLLADTDQYKSKERDMVDQKPSVGRIVLYRGIHSNGTDEHPAIINRVWSETTVNLMVFPDCGVPENKTSVVQDEEAKQVAGWRWPPRV